MVTRTETREEFEARMLRESEAVDAGAYDDIRARAREYMLSQIPDGYVFKDGYFVRTDPDLPDHFYIASISDGKPTGRMVKVTPL